MQISSEQIKAILVENGFEANGADLVHKRGAAEFMATVSGNKLDISYQSGGATGSYSLEVYSPDFAPLLDHFYADASGKMRVGMQNWRL